MEVKERTRASFGGLLPGTVFRRDERMYMKAGHNIEYDAVTMDTCDGEYVGSGERVEIVSGKFVEDGAWGEEYED